MSDIFHLAGRKIKRHKLMKCLSRPRPQKDTATYWGYDTEARYPVAVKLIPIESDYIATFRPWFESIGKAIQQVRHTKVAQTIEVGIDGRYAYVVSDYIPGRPLRDLARSIVPPATVALWGIQLARGLDACHQFGVIHRGVTPASILLRENHNESAMLTNLGLAEIEIARFRCAQPTFTEHLGGAAEYMAPELMRGEFAGACSDVYALGCVLYKLLTGEPPFVSDVPLRVAQQQLTDAATPICQLNPAVPPGLAELIERAIAKDPCDRFQTCADFAQALEPFAGPPHPTEHRLRSICLPQPGEPVRPLREICEDREECDPAEREAFQGLLEDVTIDEEFLRGLHGGSAARDSHPMLSLPSRDRSKRGPGWSLLRGRTSVYLAHSHVDIDFARRLYRDLRHAGFAVWFDAEQLVAGDVVGAMDDGLMRADFEVPVLSPRALESGWLKREIDAGIARMEHGAMRAVIPVEAQSVDPKTLKPLLGVLKRYDFSSDYDSGLRALVWALRSS